MKRAVCLGLLFLFLAGASFAADLVPRATFIKHTEAALDILDEVESSYVDRAPISGLIVKLDAALKKFDRYNRGDLGGNQGEIVSQITMASLSYDLLNRGGFEKELFDKAKSASGRARDLYGEYVAGGK